MAKMEFGELDQYLFGQATHYDIYKKLSEQIFEIKFLNCTDDCGRLKSTEEIHSDIIACLSAYGLYI